MRKDYALLDRKIKEEYVDYIKKHKAIPSQSYIAEVCGTTQVTVSKHLNNIDLSELIRPFKIFGDEVLMGLSARASKGDAQAAKLFFALVYDWTEKQEVKGELKMKAEIKNISVLKVIEKYEKALDEIRDEEST